MLISEKCRKCDGKGSIGKGKSRTCNKCNGSGKFVKDVDPSMYPSER